MTTAVMARAAETRRRAEIGVFPVGLSPTRSTISELTVWPATRPTENSATPTMAVE